MADNAWKTVVIQAYASLRVGEGSLIITSENGKEKIRGSLKRFPELRMKQASELHSFIKEGA